MTTHPVTNVRDDNKVLRLPTSVIQNGSLSTRPHSANLIHEAAGARARGRSGDFQPSPELAQTSENTDHKAEEQAIAEALRALRVLKRDKLQFPDWETR
jgi:hypothetical protein